MKRRKKSLALYFTGYYTKGEKTENQVFNEENMKKAKKLIAALLTTILTMAATVGVQAEETWPDMPTVEAPSICVMEISTGTILYERNMDEENYPASITKIMTALLALENCSLDETVVFSKEAVYGNEGDTSHISRDVDEEMTMEECLYGMMLESANECAWAIGEHVAGTMDAFVEMMNAKAAELGCTNTHFNNPNGLPDEEHWTSAHDMALIAAAAYKNETFRVITGTKSYTIPATNKHTDETPLHNHHKMLYPYHGDYAYLYDYCTGGKTGYTNAAGNTLVTYAQKDGMSLVCVVMQEKTPNHYTDTRTMFDYCFENFKLLSVADYETDVDSGQDVQPFASIDADATVVVPADASFSDLTSEILYDSEDEYVLGTIRYSYADHVVGTADVLMNEVDDFDYAFTDRINEGDSESAEEDQEPQDEDVTEENEEKTNSIHIELNGKTIALAVGLLVVLIVLVLLVYWMLTHTYLLRQKLAGMHSRHKERTRYRTIRDTQKSRKKKRTKKSKDLRF
jgi:D-alanyl-D-alanine carboxypeptidase